MKKIFVIAMLCAAAVMAQEKPEDSPLVKAAKASGGPKKKPTKKVITNADVKRARGNLVVLPPKVDPEPTPQKGMLQKQDEQRKASGFATIRMITAEKKVGELEKELRRIEDTYYAENDPNYRDKTIAERFEQTKKQLESARKELAEAREALEKLKTPVHTNPS